ncbi:hypothetical protein EXM22_16245 [Oceanispirochaeta crateris]|uniref:Sulfatase N-terminal domain-containing protein n=1 Tax=Oceanispirochaeta crateris TaxID=2518645 RepID=A0A5C1QMX0_9SPIO|nr:sulfatase-like hydrolase/transferase [Oceanispirochaeta crateris]QEN09455.1 hypothetical protein EXM22_16245 [Oceanispirochaeta crateris]
MKPNVIFILVDDLGYGDLGKYNPNESLSPHIDSLMDEGVCFSQCYAGSPVCNPSRASLLTGRYPMKTGSVDTLEWRGLERLNLEEITMADYFKAGGYKTGIVGKWHLGAFDMKYHPQNRGFDETVCFRGGMHDYYDWRLEYGNSIKRGDGRYLTDLWTDEAVDFIKRNSKEPFFLHLAYNAPHTPLQVPGEEAEPFLQKGCYNESVSALYGMIKRMDKGIGRVMEEVKNQGLDENTIIIFSSDNGPQFEYGTNHGGNDANDSLERFNCNLHGSKGTVYEGGIKVPQIIRWNNTIKAGTSDNDMFHFCDWLPSLKSLCSLPSLEKGKELDGVDFSERIMGKAGGDSPARFWQWNRYSPVPGCNTAIRDGKWKLVLPEIPEAMEVFDIQWLNKSMYEPEYFIERGIIMDEDPPRTISSPLKAELYDIESDPGETNDLADENRELVGLLENKLSSWFESEYKEYSKVSRS